MKRTIAALALLLILGLSVPASARPRITPRHHQGPTWTTLWDGFIHVIGSPFRLFDDSGTHTIPIIAPTPNPGS
jgi:hypothetical protein